jgi:hypothetical protein
VTQLGKYSTDRDNILHFLCTSDWANDSFGNVEAPTGYVWRISNDPADVQISNTEITSVIEDQLKSYDIEDSPEFRKELEGHYLIQEDSNGLVHVLKCPSKTSLVSEYNYLLNQFNAWDSQDDED